MYLAMLKKDIKQFVRVKFNLIILLAFPIVLITTLSVGLKSIMTIQPMFTDKERDVVYYTVDSNSPYKEGFLEFSKGVNEAVNIGFKECKDLQEVKEKIDSYEGIAYINFKGEKIEYYGAKDGQRTKGKIFNEIFNSFLKEFGTYETIGNFNREAFQNLVQSNYDSYIVEENMSGKKELTAGEFYTFAELALIILFLGQTIGEMTFKEKQLRTINRIVMSKANHLMMLISKISLGAIMGTIQTLLVYGYTSLVLKIDWGVNTLKFLILFIVFSIFASIMGAVVGSLAKSEGITGGVLNIISFIAGALGGCFTPLMMIISMPVINKLVYLSPIYWISTATSTMLCGFETIAYFMSLAIPIVLSMIFLIVYFMKIRRGGIYND